MVHYTILYDPNWMCNKRRQSYILIFVPFAIFWIC